MPTATIRGIQKEYPKSVAVLDWVLQEVPTQHWAECVKLFKRRQRRSFLTRTKEFFAKLVKKEGTISTSLQPEQGSLDDVDPVVAPSVSVVDANVLRYTYSDYAVDYRSCEVKTPSVEPIKKGEVVSLKALGMSKSDTTIRYSSESSPVPDTIEIKRCRSLGDIWKRNANTRLLRAFSSDYSISYQERRLPKEEYTVTIRPSASDNVVDYCKMETGTTDAVVHGEQTCVDGVERPPFPAICHVSEDPTELVVDCCSMEAGAIDAVVQRETTFVEGVERPPFPATCHELLDAEMAEVKKHTKDSSFFENFRCCFPRYKKKKKKK